MPNIPLRRCVRVQNWTITTSLCDFNLTLKCTDVDLGMAGKTVLHHSYKQIFTSVSWVLIHIILQLVNCATAPLKCSIGGWLVASGVGIIYCNYIQNRIETLLSILYTIGM